MKKKNILAIILVAIALITFVIGAIIANNPEKNEEEAIHEVISCFLAGDYVWDESHEKLVNPTYIEIYHYENDDTFSVILPVISDGEEYYLFYNPEYNEKANFFVQTPASSRYENLDYSVILLNICKAIKSGSCYLKTAEETVLISSIRVTRDGTLYAKDIVNEEWHQKVSTDEFILG